MFYTYTYIYCVTVYFKINLPHSYVVCALTTLKSLIGQYHHCICYMYNCAWHCIQIPDLWTMYMLQSKKKLFLFFCLYELLTLVFFFPLYIIQCNINELIYFLALNISISIYSLYWRRKWQPAPVFLPGEPHGQRSLEGHSSWGDKSQDTI